MSEKFPSKTTTSLIKASSIPRPSSPRLSPHRYPTIPPIKPNVIENNTEKQQALTDNRPRSAIPTPVKSNSTKFVPCPPSGPKPSKARRAHQSSNIQRSGKSSLRPLAVVGKNLRKTVIHSDEKLAQNGRTEEQVSLDLALEL